MSAGAATQAASYSKGLVLAVLVDGNKLSLRELVLCFTTCKTFRELLDGRGFCIGTAWLCAYLESGRSPTEILSRLRRARKSVAFERPLSRVDQVTSFLMRHEDYEVRWGWAWAQLLYQEPDGGVLCKGVKKMLWMLKRRLIKELHKCSGYYPGLCTWKGHSKDNPECTCEHGETAWDYQANRKCPVKGHSACVYSVAWSPCGKFFASGSWDKTMKIWDVEAGSEKCSLTGHSNRVTSVAWSPCGKFVASGSWDNTIKIWHAESGSEKCSLKGHSAAVNSVAFSPDGKYVASGSGQFGKGENSLRIWEVATGKELCSLKGHSRDVRSVAWSPDGKTVASGSDDMTIRLWDVETGREKCSLTGHSSSVGSVAWSPCGKFVASGSNDGTVKICDIQTGSEKCSLKGHSEDNPECICDFHAGEDEDEGGALRPAHPECPVRGHSEWVFSVAWSPCGRFVASGSSDRTVKIWDTQTGSEKCSLTSVHTNVVRSVAWSPDGKLVASGSDDIRIWDAATGMATMAPQIGVPSSWVDFGPEVRALAQQVGQASGHLMACTGNYAVIADDCDGDTVHINKVLEGREIDDESDDEQETEPVALFRCPSTIHTVACRPPYICAGCMGGQVLLLEAPFLCEGPGI